MQMRIFPGQLLEQSAAAVWCMVCVGMWKMCQRFKKNQRKKKPKPKVSLEQQRLGSETGIEIVTRLQATDFSPFVM